MIPVDEITYAGYLLRTLTLFTGPLFLRPVPFPGLFLVIFAQFRIRRVPVVLVLVPGGRTRLTAAVPVRVRGLLSVAVCGGVSGVPGLSPPVTAESIGGLADIATAAVMGVAGARSLSRAIWITPLGIVIHVCMLSPSWTQNNPPPRDWRHGFEGGGLLFKRANSYTGLAPGASADFVVENDPANTGYL